MDVVRGSLREFGRLLSILLGGIAEGDDRPQPPRNAVWISVQVLALALVLAVLFAVGGLFFEPAPATEPNSIRLAWAVPGFLLALPFAIHWLAGPPRRTAGLLAACATGVVAAFAVAPVVAALPALWPGLLVLTVGAFGAAVVYGLVSPIPARP